MGSGKKVSHNRHYYMIETEKDVTGYRNIQSARRSAMLMLNSKRTSVTIRKVNRTLFGQVRKSKNGFIWMQYKDGKLTDAVVLDSDGTIPKKK